MRERKIIGGPVGAGNDTLSVLDPEVVGSRETTRLRMLTSQARASICPGDRPLLGEGIRNDEAVRKAVL